MAEKTMTEKDFKIENETLRRLLFEANEKLNSIAQHTREYISSQTIETGSSFTPSDDVNDKKPFKKKLLKKVAALSKTSGIILSGLGIIVMTGWLLDIDFFKSPLPGQVSMKANTAICFILSGFYLWLLNTAQENTFKKKGALYIVLIITLTAVLTLIEYIFKIDIGIDEFFFKDVNAVATSNPGRMSPSTAICFILSGISSLLLLKKKAFKIVQFCSLVVFCLGFSAVFGYVYETKYLMGGIANLTYMAVHTSIMFIIFSLGILCTRPDRGLMSIITNDGIGGLTVRKLLPFIIRVHSNLKNVYK